MERSRQYIAQPTQQGLSRVSDLSRTIFFHKIIHHIPSFNTIPFAGRVSNPKLSSLGTWYMLLEKELVRTGINSPGSYTKGLQCRRICGVLSNPNRSCSESTAIFRHDESLNILHSTRSFSDKCLGQIYYPIYHNSSLNTVPFFQTNSPADLRCNRKLLSSGSSLMPQIELVRMSPNSSGTV